MKKGKKDCKKLSFFDVFAGSGVVSEMILQNKAFDRIYINDFLHSNFVIYKAFFWQESFDFNKLDSIKNEYNSMYFRLLESSSLDKNVESNYYELHFGNKFFSKLDSRMIGFIRDDLDMRLESKSINQKEFYILLASLLYSVDKIANTVGHYDAFRKNVALKNRFNFELIKPLKSDKKIEIFREDSNILAREILESKIDIAFLDPPYNSRQYSRFYHFLETLTLNNKPQLFGVAKKPKPQNLSKYCTKEAKNTFKDLIQNLAKISKFIIVTYNNTESANTRSNAILKENDIKEILQTFGKIRLFEVDFTPFNSGKTDKKTTFKEHKERIFVCQISH
ncbi:DNA methyltransferase [Helicobacter saguini]|uniref:site-specific DNA-methyltransferase (adenine-specific) n=1 Tax=Helicobacter saguini TaxID=1548018 RepID=A0A347VTX8_9HELI|nr:DNA methyltransferase [Helicobacter saguini]MWV68006.1 DNA methyltransferase [Helicobacter saguini]MWV70527.1 DNA methyltransferase [Helicobacter saguini]MWV72430.1 DNA methyltransferase [Helicobacter saguini]TLD94841.1 DNA methyltransferase [Helicobacter saguini]